jgi:hypothetical protein
MGKNLKQQIKHILSVEILRAAEGAALRMTIGFDFGEFV